MGIETLIKPLLAMQGFHKLHIQLDGTRRVIIITGTRYGQPVDITIKFDELEAMINGTGTAAAATADQTPDELPHSTGSPEIVDPKRS